MKDRFGQIFRIHPGEFGLVALLGFSLFLNALAQQVSEITAVSNFLSEGGVNQILLVWSVSAVIILLTMALQSLIIDKFSRKKVVQWILVGYVFAFGGLRFLFFIGAPEGLNYALLYLLAEQQWLLFPVVLWILANDVLDLAQAKRLFPIIAGGDFAGKLFGIVFSGIAPQILKLVPGIVLQDLLLFNATLYLLVFVFMWVGLRNIRIRQSAKTQETMRETLVEGWEFIREVQAFRFLALVILSVLVVDTIVEFRFLVVTDSFYFNEPARYQTFYSIYNLIKVIASLLIQTLIVSRIMTSAKLKNVFMAEPIGALLSTFWALFVPGLTGAIGSIYTLKLPQLTIGDSARRSFKALVPEERRGRVSIFMDSYLFATGTLIGCGLAGAVIFAGNLLAFSYAFYVYIGLALVSGIIGIWAALKIRTVYDQSLLNWRLKRRQRGKSVFDKLDF
jgi:hypothetical protein